MSDLIDQVPRYLTGRIEGDQMLWSPVISGALYTGPEETFALRATIATMNHLVAAAEYSRQAATYAASWRDYRVGATAVMINRSAGHIGYFSGYNIKPTTDQEGINIHAEQLAIAKGRLAGLNQLLGISIYANPNDDDANPRRRPTLVPCGRCIDMLLDTHEADDNTLVLGTDPSNETCELYTLGSLTAGHEPIYDGPFSLQGEADLEHYDRVVKPTVINRLLNL